MSKTLRVFALILLLAGPARAGLMPNGSPVAPAPQIVIQESPGGGETQTPPTVEEITAETMLSVITSVLALI